MPQGLVAASVLSGGRIVRLTRSRIVRLIRRCTPFDLTHAEDDAVIWLALAVSQSQLGRLDPAVAARALQVLDNDEDIDIWEYEGSATVRRRRRGIT